MRISVASDYNGSTMKNEIKRYLNNKGHELLDASPSNHSVDDYTDYAIRLGEIIRDFEADLGILIDGTGIGMTISANKVKNVRCAHVANVNEVTLAKEHNNVNVIALDTKTTLNEILKIIEIFLTTEFSKEERHVRRVNKIALYEQQK